MFCKNDTSIHKIVFLSGSPLSNDSDEKMGSLLYIVFFCCALYFYHLLNGLYFYTVNCIFDK